MIEDFGASGIDLIVVEPAVQLLYSKEYREVDPNFPFKGVSSLPAYLSSKIDNIGSLRRPTDDVKQVTFFGHCAETSLAPANNQMYQQILTAFGFQVDVEETTCCGMAGIFGHEKENQQLSKDLFDRYWRPKIETSTSYATAAGYSCRSQAKRLGAKVLVHPIQILADALGR